MASNTIVIGEHFRTTSGCTPLSTNRTFYDGGTIPWLTSGELFQGRILSVKNKITQKALDETSLKIVPQNSVVIAMYGATVGQVGILECETTTNQAICAILPNTNTAEPLFLYYTLLHNKPRLIGLANGSARTNISQDTIKKFSIKIFDLPTQRAITRVLSQLDEKIELNRKINAELEELARTIYIYNFVQNADPKWKRGKVAELIGSTKAGDWGQEVEQGNYTKAVTCIRGADINSVLNIAELKAPARYILNKNSDKILSDGDFIVEISGGSPTQSTGRMTLIMDNILKIFDKPLICSNFCKAFSLKDKSYFYWFYHLWTHLYDCGAFLGFESKTSGIKNFLFDRFVENYEIAVPDDLAIKAFNNQVAPFYDEIIKNRRESIELSELRDFLLPLLMNGQIQVVEKKENGDFVLSKSNKIVKDKKYYDQRFEVWLQNQGLAARGCIDKQTLREIFNAIDDDDK